MVGTLYHEAFHRCHPSPVRWLANTQPSWVDAINGHSHNTLNFACQPTKILHLAARVLDSAIRWGWPWNLGICWNYEAGFFSLDHYSHPMSSIIISMSVHQNSLTCASKSEIYNPSIKLLSCDPHPHTLFWHSFWHTIWIFCGIYIYILTFCLAFFLAYTKTFYLTFFLAFSLASILTFFLASILTFYLTFSLTFSSDILSVSGARDMRFGDELAQK
jgi:hypothetical protein